MEEKKVEAQEKWLREVTKRANKLASARARIAESEELVRKKENELINAKNALSEEKKAGLEAIKQMLEICNPGSG